MSWKFWKKRKPESYMKVVGMPTLARWYLYDTDAVDPNKLATAIGLTKVSDEGEETERIASELRSIKVEPYIGFLRSMAEINAITLTEAQRLHSPDSDDDILAAAHDMFAMASYLGIYAAFSAAFELGLITNPGTLTTTEAVDEQQ